MTVQGHSLAQAVALLRDQIPVCFNIAFIGRYLSVSMTFCWLGCSQTSGSGGLSLKAPCEHLGYAHRSMGPVMSKPGAQALLLLLPVAFQVHSIPRGFDLPQKGSTASKEAAKAKPYKAHGGSIQTSICTTSPHSLSALAITDHTKPDSLMDNG